MLELKPPDVSLPPHLEAQYYDYQIKVLSSAFAAIGNYEERLRKPHYGSEERTEELPAALLELEKRANTLWLQIRENEGALAVARQCGKWNQSAIEQIHHHLCQKRRAMEKLCVDVVRVGYQLGFRAELIRVGEGYFVNAQRRTDYEG